MLDKVIPFEVPPYPSVHTCDKKLPIYELRMGDVVSLGDYPFSTAVVVLVTDSKVVFNRPYSHVSDFAMASGLLHFTGVETISRYRLSESPDIYHVYERRGVK